MTRMTARSLIFLQSILLPALAFAQQTPQSPTEAELTSLLAIYKDVHAHPELSMHEERSAAIVAKELKAAGCEVTEHVGKYEKDRKSTRPNSSHSQISYAVFCLKKKNTH